MNILSRGFTQTHADHFQIVSEPIRANPRLILLCLIFLSAGPVFAQTNLDELKARIAVGSSEEKRNALYEIRLLHSEEASRIAVPALSDKDGIVRATAASSVIFLPPADAAKVLIPLLKDDDEFVRRETAFALGEVGSTSATQPLIENLQKEGSIENRSAAAAALGKLGDVAAIEPLSAILKKKPAEADEFLRRSAARSIGQIARIIRNGPRKIVTPQNFLPEKYKEHASGPGGIEVTQMFQTAVPILSKVLQDKKESADARREAAFALGSIGSQASVGLLRQQLGSSDYFLAEISKEALLKIPAVN